MDVGTENLETGTTKNSIFKNKGNTFLVLFIFFILAGTFLFFYLSTRNTTFPTGAVYEGIWQAPGLKPLSARLTILSNDGKKITVNYAWAINTKEAQNENRNLIFLPDGKSLNWGGENDFPHFTFTQIDENHVSGKREHNNNTIEVIMTKK